MLMIQIYHTRIGNFRDDVAGANSYSEHQHLPKARSVKLINQKPGITVELYRQTQTRTQVHRVTLASLTQLIFLHTISNQLYR